MKKNNISKVLMIITLLSSFMFTSCYDDYTDDYIPTVYFSSQKPLRTVIADRDMSIKVGVAVAGKRKVDTNDWATFTIDETLLDGTKFTLLPESYYTLSDNNTMKVRDEAIAVADIDITFTDAFYADPLSASLHYALPFQIVASSCDSIYMKKSTSIVAIKYVSTYAGTYYVQGKVDKLDASGAIEETVTYNKTNLSANITRDLSTINRNTLIKKGVANLPTSTTNEKVSLTINGTDVVVATAENGIEITDGSGTYDESDNSMTIQYKYVKDGVTYSVNETLTRRQDILKDLRYEEW